MDARKQVGVDNVYVLHILFKTSQTRVRQDTQHRRAALDRNIVHPSFIKYYGFSDLIFLFTRFLVTHNKIGRWRHRQNYLWCMEYVLILFREKVTNLGHAQMM